MLGWISCPSKHGQHMRFVLPAHWKWMLFVSSQALGAFGEHMLRSILYSPWHGMGLVNNSRDTFCVFSALDVLAQCTLCSR
jgi:hypothetical protein